MSAWTEELKAKVIKQYQDANPTPENSTEIVAEIAEEVSMSVNGVRMVLSQADVYVKKTPATAKTAAKKEGDAPKRVGKEDAIASLRAAIEAKGATVDEDVITKLTGKAALYLASVIQA